MALTRFTESYSVSADHCIKLSPTTELRQKYPEAFSRLEKGYAKITEALATSSVDLYKFPISRFDWLNQNRRKYPQALWERVIREQQTEWKGRVGLADHPPEDSDGEFKNAAIVWLDMEVDTANKLVWAVGTFVGDYGRLAQEIVDKGGRIGFSSSGFGELLSDRETVDPNSFVLERCADIVLNPSQDVFGESSNALNVEYSPQQVKESTKITAVEKDKKETRMSDTVVLNENSSPAAPVGVSKMEEKKFRKDIERFLEDAGKITDPQARLQELTEILTYFDESKAAPDLREKVESQIKEEKTALEALLAETQKIQEAFGSTSDQLKIGVALLAEEVKVAAADAKDWEGIAVALKENNCTLKKEIDSLKESLSKAPKNEELSSLKKRIEFLETQRKRQFYAYNEETEALEASIKQESAQKAAVSAQIKKLTEEKTDALSTIHALESKVTLTESLLEKEKTAGQKIFEEAQKTVEALEEQKDRVLILEGQINRLQTRLTEQEALNEKTLTEFEEYKKRITEENTPKLQPRFEERVGGYLNFNESAGAPVENFWADLVERHGKGILPYEQKIRGQKTYREASTMYLKLLPYIDSDAASAEAARITEGNFPRAERKEMLEKAGMKFGEGNDLLERNSWAK